MNIKFPRDTAPNTTCYSITGRASPFNAYTYVPCNLTALAHGQHSACCAPGDTCLTNGLCRYNAPTPVPAFNTYWRLGCTDPTYQDPACPKQCHNVEKVERQVHIVFECPGDGEWCCGTGDNGEYKDTMRVNTTCCNIEDLSFKGGKRKGYTTARKLDDLDLKTFAALEASASPASASATGLGSTTVLISDSLPTSTGSTGIAASADTSTSIPASSPASSSTNTVALGVGLGLGIPLLICILSSLFFLAYRYRQHSKSNDKHERIGEETQANVLQAYPHAFSVEKSGREIPAELDADKGPYEIWTPTEPEMRGKRLDFR